MNQAAKDNTEILLNEIMESIDEYVLAGKPLIYFKITEGIMYGLRRKALRYTHQNITRAAELLSIGRSTFYEGLKVRGWQRTIPSHYKNRRKPKRVEL